MSYLGPSGGRVRARLYWRGGKNEGGGALRLPTFNLASPVK